MMLRETADKVEIGSGFDYRQLVYLSRYRHHPGISPDDIDRMHQNVVRGMLRSEIVRYSELTGLVAVTPSQWDIMYFGMPMARVEILGANGGHPDGLAPLVLDAVRGLYRNAGCRHYSVEVDVDD